MTINETKIKLIEVLNNSELPLDILELLVENIGLTISMQRKAIEEQKAREAANEESAEKATKKSKNS